MKVTVILRNEDNTHEVIDNLVQGIEDAMKEEGLNNVSTQEFSTEYHVTGDTVEEEDEEEGEE